MKVGSLVVIKGGNINECLKPFIKWTPVMDETTIYTVRAVRSTTTLLEEGCIGYIPGNIEIGIGHSHVKEVQPPMTVSIEDLICETIEV